MKTQKKEEMTSESPPCNLSKGRAKKRLLNSSNIRDCIGCEGKFETVRHLLNNLFYLDY
jgi:hypothetical protein